MKPWLFFHRIYNQKQQRSHFYKPNKIMVYGAIIKTENGNKRKVVSALSKCNAIEKIWQELSACYYEVEILKTWLIH